CNLIMNNNNINNINNVNNYNNNNNNYNNNNIYNINNVNNINNNNNNNNNINNNEYNSLSTSHLNNYHCTPKFNPYLKLSKDGILPTDAGQRQGSVLRNQKRNSPIRIKNSNNHNSSNSSSNID